MSKKQMANELNLKTILVKLKNNQFDGVIKYQKEYAKIKAALEDENTIISELSLLKSFSRIAKKGAIQITKNQDDLNELTSYVTQLLNQETTLEKIDNLLYASILTVHLFHVSGNDDFYPLCNKMFNTLQKSLNYIENQTIPYLTKIFNEAKLIKHYEMTLQKWQTLYDIQISSISSVNYNVNKVIRKEKLNINTENLTYIDIDSWPKEFTKENWNLLKNNLKKSKELYNYFVNNFDKTELSLLMEKALKTLSYHINGIENFMNQFKEEADFVGNIEDYFNDLQSNADSYESKYSGEDCFNTPANDIIC